LTKIRPGRTHCETKFNLPNKDCKSFLLQTCFVSQSNTNCEISEWSRADQVFSVDSCLTGCGGWMNGRYFHCSFPDFILSENLHMNLCEMLTVVALKAWGSNFSGVPSSI
jgi:hypothetical protein